MFHTRFDDYIDKLHEQHMAHQMSEMERQKILNQLISDRIILSHLARNMTDDQLFQLYIANLYRR
jgi:hypothetical protein